ncbi:MAG: DUF1223 domain-containing protein [Phaeovulum sp.]|uniref:DUF1223 domain-containing protein n=1 Tax=Phaeovulum sp. TaxID=2934796 RepID=UPI00273408E8|nr:DUF1223 domain-containing protein [Phaeovulum sp.]MDP3860796.1 DUF1223 domain-containing protein [Phaeovulum sp.]
MSMKQAVIGAGIAVWLALAGQALAQTQADAPRQVVVELFTSQGCSSCPPADALLREIAADPRVLALSLHVDYWDYLGWVDDLAQPAFTMRQKAYAYAAGARAIYTPQLIVAGMSAMNGADRGEVLASLAAHSAAPAQVHLWVSHGPGGWLIEALAEPPLSEGSVVQIVRYRPEITVSIARGENAGRQATYANVVTDWVTVAEWDGHAPLQLEALVSGPDRAAVIVQSLRKSGKYSTLPGPILAAARLD